MTIFDKYNVRLNDSTFNNLALRGKFQKKYANHTANIKIGDASSVDLITGVLNNLVADHHNNRIIITGPGNLIECQQAMNQCSSIMIKTNGTSIDSYEFLEDLFSLMGYTVMLVSSINPYTDSLKKIGFIPYLQLTNRRTDSIVTFSFKQIKLWK